MKKDISSKADIQIIIDRFYEQVRADETIGFIFNDIAKVDWPHHMPIMYDFWESTVFGTGTYTRNAMTPHFQLNEKVPLTAAHFERWLQLFESTIDALFEGASADLMKERGKGIAGLMQLKLNGDKHKIL
jgi:hemoglobin